MSKAKKLKDLKAGDHLWLYNFTGTTSIDVVKVKREGNIAIVTVRWDNEEFIAYGPALGWSCTAYNQKYQDEFVLTSRYNDALQREKRNELNDKQRQIGQTVMDLITLIKS